MVFKLVRTDTEEPCKIQLPVGTHLIGRGKFLDCDDKRVSRKHGELKITIDTISIRSLHQNPCFYTKKGSEDIEVLKQGCTIDLYNGDKFGLLPDTFWFELMHCVLGEDTLGSESTQPLEETITATEPHKNRKDQNGLGNSTDDENLANVDIHEAITQRCASPTLTIVKSEIESPKTSVGSSISSSVTLVNVGSPSITPSNVRSPSITPNNVGSPSITPNNVGSPSLLPNNTDLSSITTGNIGSPCLSQNESVFDLRSDSPSLLPNLSLTTTESLASESNQSPTKRCHSSASEDEAKKIKTEPQDVKQEPDPQPGPSGDQGNAPGPSDNNNANRGIPPSPGKPNPPGRERCIYGANCYRKNPAHKAQFAHPTDADWGTGERGECPYGRACLRRDPRHWRDHSHPDGTRPPPPSAGNNRLRQNKPTQRKRRQSTQDSDEDSLQPDLIVTGKRARKTIQRQSWSGSDEEVNEDPYQTDDDEDDWVPSTQSQYTQDTQDD